MIIEKHLDLINQVDYNKIEEVEEIEGTINFRMTDESELFRMQVNNPRSPT
jgi:hypothetical protein